MRRLVLLSVCLLVAVSTEARKKAATCVFHIEMTHALPPGTIAEVRVAAVGATRIVKVTGYAWSVQPNYPLSATLTPPATGPENLSMISVEIDSLHASGAQKIVIEWRGGKPRKTLCHRVLDLACGRLVAPRENANATTVSLAREAIAAPAGTLVDCRLVTADVVEEGALDTSDGDCEPSFTIEDRGCNTFAFRNTTEYDVIGMPAKYAWSVVREDGDGEVEIPLPNPHAENQTITFPGPGTYLVSLKASGLPCGDESEVITEEVVVGADLAAKFSLAPLPTKPFAVRTTNQSAAAAEYEWTFGDNSAPSTEKEPQHAFTQPGSYDVCLTAISKSGCKTTSCKQLKVSADCTLDFVWSYEKCRGSAGSGYDVTFTNKSSSVATNTHFFWNFGDIQVAIPDDEVTVKHPYSFDGEYTVILESSGCTAKSEKIRLHDCTADFTVEQCADRRVYVKTDAEKASWDFMSGNPATSDKTEEVVLFPPGTQFPITLTTEDVHHCKCQSMQLATPTDECCRKNQTNMQWTPFDYNGSSFRVKQRLSIRNVGFAHWVRVKMIVKRLNKQGHFRRFKAASLSIDWSGKIYRKGNKKCFCAKEEDASDSVPPHFGTTAKKSKLIAPMDKRFWTRTGSITAKYFVKIDGNDPGRTLPPLSLSKKCQ